MERLRARIKELEAYDSWRGSTTPGEVQRLMARIKELEAYRDAAELAQLGPGSDSNDNSNTYTGSDFAPSFTSRGSGETLGFNERLSWVSSLFNTVIHYEIVQQVLRCTPGRQTGNIIIIIIINILLIINVLLILLVLLNYYYHQHHHHHHHWCHFDRE